MKDGLTELFQRLKDEGASAMPEIYARTSSHLFGIVKNIVPDDNSAQDILKSVYARLWDRRHNLANRHKGNPLNYLRRLAHRMAIDHKFQENTDVSVGRDLSRLENFDFEDFQNLDISQRDMRILNLAYLTGASLADISRHEGLDPDEVKASLENTVTRLRGEAS